MSLHKKPEQLAPVISDAETMAAPLSLPRLRPSWRTLESRLVFDGALIDTAQALTQEPAPGGESASAGDHLPSSEAHASASQDADLATALTALSEGIGPAGHAIIFIDRAVADAEQLAAVGAHRAHIVMLQSDRDGLAQIAEYLHGKRGIETIHILSHGEPGRLQLGSGFITTSTLATRADELATIRAALTDDADILIYGCDVARGAEGEAFVRALAAATGADIAASDDPTGHKALGGDWDLERRAGTIEARVIEAPDWQHLMAPLVVSVSGAPTLTGVTGTDPVSGLTSGGVGMTALWVNAGTIGGTAIDIKATVLSLSSGTASFATLGDDLTFVLNAPNSLGVVRWEIFASGTNQTIYAVGSPNLNVLDIDGAGGVPNSREIIRPQLQGLTGYSLESPTNLVAAVSPLGVQVSGTQNETANPPQSVSMVRFTWQDVSSWTIEYQLMSTASNAAFRHDGDGDFTFSAPSFITLLGLDLDANNSTASGTAYQTTFVENGAPVAIVDADVNITQNVVLGTTLNSAKVTLANAQAGDRFVVAGSTATSGTFVASGATFNYTVTAGGGEIAIALNGIATPAQYEAALRQIQFENTLDNPATLARQIFLSVRNGTFGTTSNEALATIHVSAVNDAPVDANETATINAARTLTGNLLANASDIDGDTLSISAFSIAGAAGPFTLGTPYVIADKGTLTVNANGTYTFKADHVFNGELPTITYTVSDGNGGADTSTLAITVEPFRGTLALVSDPPEVVATNITGNQSPPKIVELNDGRLLYVWSNNALADDTTSMTIHGRIYNANGTPASGQFQIGTLAVEGTDGYDVDNLDVDVLAGGNVVVSWQRSFANTGGDEPVFTIINPSIAPGSPGFIVVQDVEAQQNDVTTWESPPTTLALADGRFMVIWYRNGLDDNGTTLMVRARIFNASGMAATNEFAIGTWAVDGFDGYDVPNLTATELAGGNVVVAYVRNTSNTGGDEPVFAIINPSIMPGAPGFIVAEDVEMQQFDVTTYESPPVITRLSDGRFMAAWVRNGANDDASMEARGRIFNANGTPATGEFSLTSLAVDGYDPFDTSTFSLTQLDDGRVVFGFVKFEGTGSGLRSDPHFTVLDPSKSPSDPAFIVARDVQINISTTAAAAHAHPPLIAALPGGRFAAVWIDEWASNGHLRARVFDSAGRPLTAEQQITTTPKNLVSGFDGFDWDNVTVRAIGSDRIEIGWVGVDDGNGTGVFRTRAEIVALSSPEATMPASVAENTTGNQSPPKIVKLNDGRLLYVWSNNALADDTATMTIQGRLLNANGTPASAQFQIGTLAVDGADGYDVDHLDIDVLAGGNVVVSWQRSFANAGGDEPVFTIINPSVAPGAPGFVVVQDVEAQQNDVTTWESPPTTVALADGRFMVIWYRNGLDDGLTSMVVRARIFNANGAPSTNEFQIGTWAVDGFDGYDVPNLTATQTAGGQVVVAWVRSTGNPGADEPVFAIINPSISPGMPGFIVAQDVEMQQTDVTTYESPPVITALADGRFMAVWVRDGASDNLTSMVMRGRIFNANGTPATDEFAVGSLTVDGFDGYNLPTFSITALADGRVAIGFVQSSGSISGAEQPYVTIINPALAPSQSGFTVAADVRINNDITAAHPHMGPPKLLALPGPGGRFVAAWFNANGGDGHLIVRAFDSAGRPISTERQITINGLDIVSGNDSFDWDAVQLTAIDANTFAIGWVAVSDGNGTGAFTSIVELRDLEPLTPAVPGLVNQYTAGDQSPPKIVQLNDGRLLYVWSNNATSDDTTTMTLQGRIYGADGLPASGQFQIGTLAVDGTDGYDVDNLDVDVLAGGRVVVSWLRSYANNSSQMERPVFTVLDPSVAPGAPGFVVAQDVMADQANASGAESPPTTLALADGRFMVIWYRNALQDNGTNMAVQARFFNADGTAESGEFQIGTWSVDGWDAYDVPALTATQLAGGNVVVAFVRNTSNTGGDEPVFSIINPSQTVGWYNFFVALDVEMQQTDVTTYESPPVITALSDGRFMAVWVRDGGSDDATSMVMRGRIFNADGTSATDEFAVGSLAVDGTGVYDAPHVTITELGDGRLVVGYVRSHANAPGSHEPRFTIIDPSLSPSTPGFTVVADIQINDALTTQQAYLGPPKIIALPGTDGRFVAAWVDAYTGDGDLKARVFDSSGRAVTNEMRLSNGDYNRVSGDDRFDWDNFTLIATGEQSFVAGWVGVWDGAGNGTGVYSTLARIGMAVPNTPPVDGDETVSFNEDTTASGNLLANATDANGDPLSVSQFSIAGQAGPFVVGAPYTIAGVGTVTLQANGSYTFTPAANYNGAVPAITYTVSDGRGGTDTSTLTLSITATNDAPVDTGETVSVTEDTPASGNLLANASDVDGDALSVSAFSIAGQQGPFTIGAPRTIPGVGTLTIQANGGYTFTPAANYNGPVPAITYTVSDGNGGTATSTLTMVMVPVNDAPVDAGETPSVMEDIPVSGNVLANASDVDGDTLSVSAFSVAGQAGPFVIGTPCAIAGVGTITIHANGNYTFTPAANYAGTVPAITYTVSDGNGGTATSTLQFTMVPVNDAPVANADHRTMAEGSTLAVGAASGLLANDTDVEGNPLTLTGFQIAGDPTVYTPGSIAIIDGIGTLMINANGSYSFNPHPDYNGAVPTITYTISDGQGGTASGTFNITVTPVNDAPTAVSDGPVAVTEDTPASGNVLANDSDVDGDTLSVTQFAITGVGTFAAGSTATIPGVGMLIVHANGNFTFTPVANYNGPVPSVTYTVTDGSAASTGLLAFTAVAPVNDSPVARNDALTTSESAAFTGSVFANNGHGADSDIDGDALTVTRIAAGSDVAALDAHADGAGVGAAVAGSHGGLFTVNANGSISFNPAGDFRDLATGQSRTTSIVYQVSDGAGGFARAVVSMTVTGVTEPVIIAPPTQSANGTLTVSGTGEPGATVVVTFPDGSSATTTVAPDGTYSAVSATPQTSGTVLVTQTDVAANTETVTATFADMNPPLAPAIASVSQNPNGTLTVSGTGEPGSAVTVTFPDGSTASAEVAPDGSYAITSATPQTSGTVSAAQTDDAGNTSAPTTYSFVGMNAPIAISDALTVKADRPGIVDVLANDRDQDGDRLRVIAATAGRGHVTILSDGKLRYMPAPGFSGTDVITYTISDGNGGTATATVLVTVEEPPHIQVNDAESGGVGTTMPTMPTLRLHDVSPVLLDAINELGSLGGLSGSIGTDGAVSSAVAWAGGLNREAGVDGSYRGSVDVVDKSRVWSIAARLTQLGFGRQLATDGPDGLTGFSLRLDLVGRDGGITARDQLVIEALVRARTLIVQISTSVQSADGPQIEQVRVLPADGARLPTWLHRVAPDLLIGERPAGTERITLKLEVRYSDGTIEKRFIVIEALSGDVYEAGSRRADVVVPFQAQFALNEPIRAEDVAGLACLLKAS